MHVRACQFTLSNHFTLYLRADEYSLRCFVAGNLDNFDLVRYVSWRTLEVFTHTKHESRLIAVWLQSKTPLVPPFGRLARGLIVSSDAIHASTHITGLRTSRCVPPPKVVAPNHTRL
jgi:hypothetical protein